MADNLRNEVLDIKDLLATARSKAVQQENRLFEAGDESGKLVAFEALVNAIEAAQRISSITLTQIEQ